MPSTSAIWASYRDAEPACQLTGRRLREAKPMSRANTPAKVAALVSTLLTAAAITCASPASAAPPLPPSPAITPGAGIASHNPDWTDGTSCTAGWLAHDQAGLPVMLSAGHCDHGAVAMKWSQTDAYETIGTFTQSIDQGMTGEDTDIGLITLSNNAIPTDTRVLSRRPVEGVTIDVKVGDVLCKYGNTTGRQCGAVLAAPTASKVRFSAASEGGDSGGPVYLIRPDGDAVAVGVTLGHTDAGGTVAELLQPWLQKWNLTLDTTPKPTPTDGTR